MDDTTSKRSPAESAGNKLGPTENFLDVILSFDIEEHHRIESAAKLPKSPEMQAYYDQRLQPSTEWLLERLEELQIKATFFVVGQVACTHPQLVRRIAQGGHEVASHSWDHRRLHSHTPTSFRKDLYVCRDALEQASGQPVVGYRAPTFSIIAQHAWAIDVLADEGYLYDSSIFPVRHDRYGVPKAPRAPFLVSGHSREILEIPPATMRLWRWNLPAGGGGYFRLFPLAVLRRALRQIRATCSPSVAMLYFHPWEFDPDQLRMPLGRVNSFRTYVGIGKSRARLLELIADQRFARAVDVVKNLQSKRATLPRFALAPRGSTLVKITHKDGDSQPVGLTTWEASSTVELTATAATEFGVAGVKRP